MADKTPPRPKPDIDTKEKDLEAEDRLGNFEIQSLAADPDDREEIPDLDVDLLDIALMEDPDAGGEVFGQATLQATPIDDGGEIAGTAGLTSTGVRKSGEDQEDYPAPPPPPPPPPPRAVAMPADDGGEVFANATLQMTPIDDGGEILEDPDGGGAAFLAMPADDGGEIADVGGNVMESARAQKEAVRQAQRDLEQHKVAAQEPGTAPGDPDGGGEIFSDPEGGGEIFSDPEGGGEIAAAAPATPPGVPVPYPNIADDPDGGDEIDGGFGSGAMPPRPVTMTIDDLQGDPDGGGEVTDDPDGGDEVASRPPLDGIGVDDLTIAEDPDGGGEVAWGADDESTLADLQHGVEPPPPDFTDLEVSGTFDEASHTFEGE